MKFNTGKIYATRGAIDTIPQDEIFAALDRHRSGDWGDVCAADRKANEDALREDERLFSVYHTQSGTKFWIITEWDRSATTVLLPEEY